MGRKLAGAKPKLICFGGQRLEQKRGPQPAPTSKAEAAQSNASVVRLTFWTLVPKSPWPPTAAPIVLTGSKGHEGCGGVGTACQPRLPPPARLPLPSSPMGLLPASSQGSVNHPLACPWPGQPFLRTRWGWTSTKSQNPVQWVLRSPYLAAAIAYFYKTQKCDFFPRKSKMFSSRSWRLLPPTQKWCHQRPWRVGPLTPSHESCLLVFKGSRGRWRAGQERAQWAVWSRGSSQLTLLPGGSWDGTCLDLQSASGQRDL